jgi:tRNA(Arg) A34 adenosine deaminase TadA
MLFPLGATMKIAAVPFQSTWLYARRVESAWTLDSPLMLLIQSVYLQYPREALRILRQRIHLNFQPNEAERALVKIAAKRFEFSSAVQLNAILETGTELAGLEAKAALFPTAVNRTATKSVACVIVVPNEMKVSGPGAYSIVGVGKNQAWFDRTAHAEIEALRMWRRQHGEKLPAGAKILVDLKPCRMCAACILEFAGSHLEVLYRSPDGPASLATALDRVECLGRLEPGTWEDRILVEHSN